jgi:tetratricopeptide (TPR) repeat protein
LKEAVSTLSKGLNLVEKVKSEKADDLRERAFVSLSRVYVLLKDYGEALDFILKAIKLEEKKAIKLEMVLSGLYHEAGMIYFFMRKGREAIEMFDKSRNLKEIVGDQVGISRLHQQMGEVYMFISKDFKRAREEFEKTLNLRREIYGDEHSETKQVQKMLQVIESNIKRAAASV